MFISRVIIINYRNYKNIEIPMHRQNIIVGANKVGKSNLISAIRLALDPNLTTQSRKLNSSDFWDGEGEPFDGRQIIVVVEFMLETTNERDEMMKINALIPNILEDNGDSTTEGDKDDDGINVEEDVSCIYGIARFTYEFYPREDDEFANLDSSSNENDSEEPVEGHETKGDGEQENSIATYHPSQYRHIWYASIWYEESLKKKIKNKINSDDLSYKLIMLTLRALRDTEDLLSTWARSPLKSLLEGLELDRELLGNVATSINIEAAKVATDDLVDQLMRDIDSHSSEMVGDIFNVGSTLSAITDDPDDLLKSLQLFVDRDRPKPRPVSHASLGTLNVLYLALLLEDMKRNKRRTKQHMVLALEEPEAHVHPHVQRSLFRYFVEAGEDEKTNTLIVTTHSPHIVSVSPIKSLIVLRDSKELGTTPSYVSERDFTDAELLDIQRYLDVTRGELIFAKSIIFAEGITEKYLLPIFAKILDIDFDHLGISVISVESTDFLPYVKLVSERNLDIPFVVLTDLDKSSEEDDEAENSDSDKSQPGLVRANKLARLLDPSITTDLSVDQLAIGGIFLGNFSTLEIELIKTCSDHMCTAYDGLVARQITRDKFRDAMKLALSEIAVNSEDEGVKEVLNRIKNKGKGRFAQRLSVILESGGRVELCPPYIVKCLRYAEVLSLQSSGLASLMKHK